MWHLQIGLIGLLGLSAACSGSPELEASSQVWPSDEIPVQVDNQNFSAMKHLCRPRRATLATRPSGRACQNNSHHPKRDPSRRPDKTPGGTDWRVRTDCQPHAARPPGPKHLLEDRL